MEMVDDLKNSMSKWFDRNSSWLEDGADILKGFLALIATVFVATLFILFNVVSLALLAFLSLLSEGNKRLKKKISSYKEDNE